MAGAGLRDATSGWDTRAMVSTVERMRLDEWEVQTILAMGTGATAHAVANVVGAYRGAVRLADKFPDDPQWDEMATRNARKLHAFWRTGDPEKLK